MTAIDALKRSLTGNLHPEQGAPMRRRGRAEPLAAGLLRLRPGPNDDTGGATGQPRESIPPAVSPRGGLLRLRRIAVCAHAAARRDPGGVPLRWCCRGTARQRLIPRWWRAEDCGAAQPVMIANGRRIEQRTELGTQ